MSLVGSPSVLGFDVAEVLIGIGESAVVLFLIFIDVGAGIGVAGIPECLDEGVSFCVALQCKKLFTLLRLNDVWDVFFDPLTVVWRQVLYRIDRMKRGQKEEEERKQQKRFWQA